MVEIGFIQRAVDQYRAAATALHQLSLNVEQRIEGEIESGAQHQHVTP